MEAVYKPISCSLYDTIENFVVKKQTCVLEYINEQGENCIQETVIVDVFSKNKQEFLRTQEGLDIRLDKLLKLQ